MKIILGVALVCLAGTVSYAQATNAVAPRAEGPSAREYSMDGLNVVGAAATLPRFSETVLGTESGFPRALFRKGILIRIELFDTLSPVHRSPKDSLYEN